MAKDIVDRLREVTGFIRLETGDRVAAAASLPEEAASEIERLREALERIAQWADAYPTKVFPEPDFKRAAAALSAAGMSLDVVSASNMRHATAGVGEIARVALSQ